MRYPFAFALLLGVLLAAALGYKEITFVGEQLREAAQQRADDKKREEGWAAHNKTVQGSEQAARDKEASPEEQVEAKAAVQDLIQAGAFKEVAITNGIAEAIVTDKFMSLDFKKKEFAIVIVSSWAYKTPKGKYPAGLVILKHVRTGKKVGEFGPFGFSMTE